MNEPDLPSDSDVSDEDYRPSGEESGGASEEESDGDVEEVEDQQSGDEDGKKKKPKKNKKRVKKKNLKRKTEVEEEPEQKSQSEGEKKLSTEEEKKKADSLWADFLKDCGPPVKKKSVEPAASNSSEKRPESPRRAEEKENNRTVTQIFEFAGEKVSVEKQIPVTESQQSSGGPRGGIAGGGGGRGRGSASGGGLSAILGQLGKKGKLSTLEKSKLDWDNFKKQEGIDDEIQLHNKGKDGYLERQDFLQRTDLRRFEIEKQLRATKRSNR